MCPPFYIFKKVDVIFHRCPSFYIFKKVGGMGEKEDLSSGEVFCTTKSPTLRLPI